MINQDLLNWIGLLSGILGIPSSIIGFIILFNKSNKIEDYVKIEKMKKEIESSKNNLIKNMTSDLDLIVIDGIYDAKTRYVLQQNMYVIVKYKNIFPKRIKIAIENVMLSLSSIEYFNVSKNSVVNELQLIVAELKTIKDTNWGGKKSGKQ